MTAVHDFADDPNLFPVITALDFTTSLAELQAMKAMAVINSGVIPEAVTGDMLANIKQRLQMVPS